MVYYSKTILDHVESANDLQLDKHLELLLCSRHLLQQYFFLQYLVFSQQHSESPHQAEK